MHLPRRKHAFTLLEAIVVVVIGCMMVMLVIQWQARFSTMFASNVADIALQTDARVLFDYISTDLTSAVLVATGKQEKLEDFDWKATGAGQALVIIKLKKDPKGRHVGTDGKKPAYEGYPHYTDDGEATVQKWPATRVTYETEADPNAPPDKPQLRVFRTEEEGTFQRKEETPKCDYEQGWSYQFSSPKLLHRRKQYAEKVTSFAIVPLAFLPKAPAAGGTPAQGQQPPNDPNAKPGYIPPTRFLTVWKKDKPCAQLYHVTALGVHYVSEDVKQGAKGTEGRVELVCKYYIEERSAAFRFDAAFSSVDETL